MKNSYLLGILFLVLQNLNAQNIDSISISKRTVKVNDFKYREDQFYIGVHHTIYQNLPDNFKANGISTGFQAGFLRDFPINSERTFAIAPGVGVSFYNHYHNLITFTENNPKYLIDKDFTTNRHNMWLIDIPLEIRWRNSTFYSHKFWRIYSGIKFSYLFSSQTKYNGYFGAFCVKNDANINRSQFSIYLSAGFNTWNIYASYGLMPLYKSNSIPQNATMHPIQLGLMFYIL